MAKMRWKRPARWALVLLLAGGLIAASLEGSPSARQAAAQAGNTDTSTNNLTITSTPAAPLHIVISEFSTRGPKGDGDEFIELYNPTGAPVNISGWYIRKSADCSTSIGSVAVITSNTILLPGQHYLLASYPLSSTNGDDQNFTGGIDDYGGLALINNTGQTVDQVGMCISTLYREGANLNPMGGNSYQSYERRPGGATACYDTDNNAGDFVLINPPHPQNKASQVVMCSGVPVFTPSFTPTITSTRTVPPTATTIPGAVVINEFLPHARTDWNGDGTADVGDEYIELMNMGVKSINIRNWRLDNGANTPSFSLPNLTLLPRGIAVFYHAETGIRISDGGGSVRLVKSDGRTADIFNYPAVEFADRTWCRLPDGNGTWSFTCKPSPGLPNVPLEGTNLTAAPNVTPGMTPAPDCTWAEHLPPEVVSVECGGTGARVWIAPGAGKRWLPLFWKWDVFIE